MTDLTACLTDLSEPRNLSASFDKHLRALLGKVGDEVVAAYAVSLLAGEDPARYPLALRHLGGEQAQMLLRSGEFGQWPEVWGARALRYVWTKTQAEEATRLVLAHLADPRWRVAEMSTKVVRAHGLVEGADSVAHLTTHRLPRVRVQAVRALGVVGAQRHLAVLQAALVDEEKDVRREAVKALRVRAEALDIPESRLRG